MTAVVAVAAVSVLVIMPCSLSFISQLVLKRLLDAFKSLQIIVHVMLIDLFSVAHCEVFFGYVLQISNLQFFDPSGPMVDTLPVFENEAINIHFEETGYEYSDSILSMGSAIVILVIAPSLVVIILAMRFLCCCQLMRNFFKRQLQLTLFNRAINFVDA